MDRDFILAREAQLVYSNSAASGFSPVGDSLARWQGTLTYTTNRGRNRFVFEVFLPEYFPNVPPVVMAVGFMDHPNIDGDNFVQLRIFQPPFHLWYFLLWEKDNFSRNLGSGHHQTETFFKIIQGQLVRHHRGNVQFLIS